MDDLDFDTTTIGRFSSILRYNLEIYLNLYTVFMKDNYPFIYNYFTKPGFDSDAASFDFLASMIQESDKVNSLLAIHGSSFQKIDDWNLLDFLEEIRVKLQTTNNLSKWTRSSLSQNSWSSVAIQSRIQLKQNQTLEDLTFANLNDNNNQNDWIGVAIENNLFESDYSIKGGTVVTMNKPLGSSPSYFLSSIVDTLNGESLYGLDFNNKINWVENDLALLSYTDTAKQACQTLITLRIGDVPEFYNFGVDDNLLTGNSLGSLSYVSLIRQLTQVFATDDSLRNFKVTQFSYKGGVSYVDYSVDTFYNFVYKNSTPLSKN